MSEQEEVIGTVTINETQRAVIIAAFVLQALTLLFVYNIHRKTSAPAHANCLAERMIKSMSDGRKFEVQRKEDGTWEVKTLQPEKK